MKAYVTRGSNLKGPKKASYRKLYIYIHFIYIYIYFFFLDHAHAACGIFVPQPGIEPRPLVVKAWSLKEVIFN